MKRVRLGDTALEVSALCMGTSRMGSEIDERTSFARLDRFMELGGNFLDTAHMYADWIADAERSASEKTLGRWLRARGAYQSVVIATKGGHHDLSTGEKTIAPEPLRAQIEASRRNLGLDTIDLYYLHRDDEAQPVEAIMDILFEHRLRGHIRYLGASNWRAERIAAANAYAASCHQEGFCAVSNRWSMARCIPGSLDATLVDMDDALYALHRETGIAAVPYTSTAKGYLSKLLGGAMISGELRACYGLSENDALAMRAEQLARGKGVSPAQIALAYFGAQPFCAVPVTAFSSEAQMLEAAHAADMALSGAEYAFLLGGKDW